MSLIDRAGSRDLAVAVVVIAAAAALSTGLAAAAGPFGVGMPEPAPSAGGFLPGLFGQIALWQSEFYRGLTATIREIKTDGRAGVWLCLIAFAYGVLHAAGPGHGKAIVSAYVLANRETARNGAILALVSALAQAVTGVALVGIAAVVLGATSIAMTRATEVFEIGSYGLVTALGAYLVWRKIALPLREAFADRYAPVAVAAGGRGEGPDHDHGHHHHHGHDHSHHHHGHDHHGHGHGAHDHGGLACDCGHVHGASPALASGPLDWSKAWTTVVAVGLRPCTGALIVLVFALSQGLVWAGVAATFAMAFGTGLTVAALTLLAVSARGFAVRMSGEGSATAERVHHTIEGVGAVVVLAFGVLMLGASLSG